jgi:2-polyprenyl-3-methyl-5-hydroxy-6-metoxy-1,4-benzoquinol methylase
VSSGQDLEQRAEHRARAEPSATSGPGKQIDDLLIAALGAQIATATVLDCGGGTGRYAVPLAVAGASVTVVDVSADALATLHRRAVEADVAERVRGVQGDVEALADAADGGPFDLVLAHGILDAVDRPATTFGGIVASVRPGGLLSVMIANPVAAVLARALAGDLVGAEHEVAMLDDGSGDIATPDAVLSLCAEHGLAVEHQSGIGIFRDLVPGQALEAPGARDALIRLETACAQRAPFAQIAGRVHVLARRPASG